MPENYVLLASFAVEIWGAPDDPAAPTQIEDVHAMVVETGGDMLSEVYVDEMIAALGAVATEAIDAIAEEHAVDGVEEGEIALVARVDADMADEEVADSEEEVMPDDGTVAN